MKNIIKDYVFSFFWPGAGSSKPGVKELPPPKPVYLIDRSVVRAKTLPFSYGVAMGGYSRRDIDPKTRLGQFIHAAKYEYSLDAANALAELSIKFLQNHPLPRIPAHIILIPETMVNRPLRINHIIARRIADFYGARLFDKIIFRKRLEKPQKRRGVEERLSDDRLLFGIKSDYSATGKVVLIVDDIFDTGRSVNEAALLIQQTAPVDIMVFALVRLENRSG